VALPGKQAANGENIHQPKYREKPVYSTQKSNTVIFYNIAINTGLVTNIFQFKPPAGVSIFKMQ